MIYSKQSAVLHPLGSLFYLKMQNNNQHHSTNINNNHEYLSRFNIYYYVPTCLCIPIGYIAFIMPMTEFDYFIYLILLHTHTLL